MIMLKSRSVSVALSLLLGVLTPAAMGQQTFQVHGSGTTNPSKCYWRIMDLMMDRIKLPTRLTYRAVGSSTGQAELAGTAESGYSPDNDFGSGDIPIPTDLYESLNSANISIVQLPLFVGAISIFHSVPNVPEGRGGLNLTSCLIAKIFKRDITDWMDSEITDLNPNLKNLVGEDTFPIRVARRVLGSSSTSSVTGYLRAACPTEWPEESVGSTITWAADTDECEGSGGMTTCIRDNIGTIGYIDAGHGHDEGLVEIELKNADGNFVSSISSGATGIAAATEKASLPSSADGDFGAVELLNQAGEFTWPIVAMTYVYVRKDLSHIDATNHGLLIAFLRALYDPEYIEPCHGLFGFSPLPEAVVQLALDGIEMLEVGSTTDFTFEGETEPNVGQGDFVISSKRQTYAEYQRSTFAGDIEDLMALNSELSMRLAVAESKLATMESAAGVKDDDNTPIRLQSAEVFTSTDSQQIQAALVLASISFVFWCVAFMVLMSQFVCKN